MKILRKGARANHGLKAVNLKPSKMQWSATAEAFDITFASSATDFNTDARHVYRMRYAPGELAAMLSMLSEAAESMGAEDFASVFGKVASDIYRLHAMACGLKVAA
jgi:hypothetical protein